MIVVQVNVSANWGSTGRIAEEIGHKILEINGDSYIVYRCNANKSASKLLSFSPKWGKYSHYFMHALFDREGLQSNRTTWKFIYWLKTVQPDIVHLHNIHDHWFNYQILFEYLNQTDIKVVWTFHDFWAITGHCTHFVQTDCKRFITGCYDCPYTHGKFFPLLKRTKRNFNLKKKLFNSNKNLTIVPVSEWVGDIVRQSFLRDKNIHVISNGVNTKIFKPTRLDLLDSLSYSNFLNLTNGKFVIMAVSSQWKSGAKGLDDYNMMSKLLCEDELIVLVGVPDDISKNFSQNIIGIRRTNNQQELAALYTRADVVCSFSLAETFGLTIVEGYACGTPAVVYDNTAPPSLITPETGIIVPNRDYKTAYHAIQEIRVKGKNSYSEACIRLVNEKYNKDKCYEEYIELYRRLSLSDLKEKK